MSPSGLRERLSVVSGRDVSRETFDRIIAYVATLREAALGQNLIAPSTMENIWERHIMDSAQLVRFSPSVRSSWTDVGSGAGLPGIVVALLIDGSVKLIEPRRLRAEFLLDVISKLDLGNRVSVECSKVERATGRSDVICARAVAALDRLFAMSAHLAGKETVWVLPKGKNAQSELAQAGLNWHCNARVEQSCTDPESEILVLTRVGAK